MTHRERYTACLTFQPVDRIPFMPGNPRESTLRAWQKQGLPEGEDFFRYLIDLLGIDLELPKNTTAPRVNFRMMPQFEEKVIERKEGSLIVQDWKGNICEISDEFDVSYLNVGRDFVTRRWIKCPVENWSDWEQMKTRYDADTPGRFPEDFSERCRKMANRDYPIGTVVSGPFWQLREWMGFEGLCMAFIDQPDLIRDMIDFWGNFVSRMFERILQGVVPDHVIVNEDMAYKVKSMISPHMVREFILPTWRRWGDILHSAGCKVYDVDSDGYIAELMPLFIEGGFQVTSPMEVAAGNDLPSYRKEFGNRIAYRGGVDKRAMAKGGQVIVDEVNRLMPVIKSGGYIPGCDHGIPSDISWPNMIEYSKLLAQATGWL